MIPLSMIVRPQGEFIWPDVREDGFTKGTLVGIARIPKAMASGKSAVVVRVHLPDGTVVLAETTMHLIKTALDAFAMADREGL